MHDPTENNRRYMVCKINDKAAEDKKAAIHKYGEPVWTTDEVRDEFEVDSFAAPFMLVRRKSDGRRGSLTFQHSPRFYFHPNFEE
jgi:hypothetical protein